MELKGRWPGAPIRWVAPRNIHITLKFLGDISVQNVSMIQAVLDRVALEFSALEVNIGQVGAFPSLQRPRIVWVGVQAPPILVDLQRMIEAELAHLGYAPEDRPFSPHLTLGRLSRNASPADQQQVSSVLAASRSASIGKMRVECVNLYSSDLQPGGAIYKRLHSAALCQPTRPGAGKISS
jgi:2'-5' RNA ligase